MIGPLTVRVKIQVVETEATWDSPLTDDLMEDAFKALKMMVLTQ